MKPRITPLVDMELQSKAIKAGQEYADLRHPGFKDLPTKALIQNACAAGYSKGYRDAQAEAKPAETTCNS